MSAPIQKFIDRIQGLEARGSKDFTMSLAEAKSVQAEITRLLLELNEYKTREIAESKQEQVITVEIAGNKF
jgi:hypothetical protein